MANKKKDYATNYVLENINQIIETYIKILPNHILQQLKRLVKENNIVTYKLHEERYAFGFLGFFKEKYTRKSIL